MGFDAEAVDLVAPAGALAPAARRDRDHPRPRRPGDRRPGRLAAGVGRGARPAARAHRGRRPGDRAEGLVVVAGRAGPRPGPPGARRARLRAPRCRRSSPTTSRSPEPVRRGGAVDHGRAGRRRVPGHRDRAGPGRPAGRRRGDVRAAADPGPRRAGLVAGAVRRLGLGGGGAGPRRRACCGSGTTRSSTAASTPARRLRPAGAAAALEPTVVVRPEASAQATVLEVRTADRPGVVYLVCSALAGLDVAVRSAHVDTLGPQAVDVFYLQEASAGVLGDQRAAEAAHAVRAALAARRRLSRRGVLGGRQPKPARHADAPPACRAGPGCRAAETRGMSPSHPRATDE